MSSDDTGEEFDERIAETYERSSRVIRAAGIDFDRHAARPRPPTLHIEYMLKLLVTTGFASADIISNFVKVNKKAEQVVSRHFHHIKSIWSYQRLLEQYYSSVRVRAQVLNTFLQRTFDPVLIGDSEDEQEEGTPSPPALSSVPPPPPCPPFLMHLHPSSGLVYGNQQESLETRILMQLCVDEYNNGSSSPDIDFDREPGHQAILADKLSFSSGEIPRTVGHTT